MTTERHVIAVDETDFEERVVEASRRTPVLVDFWAGWCQPCLVLGPVLERLAGEYAGRFTLAKVDVDANPGLATRFGIRGIPAVKAFRDGAVAAEFMGVQPEDLIRRFLEAVVPSPADERVAEARASASPEDAEAGYREALAIDPSNVGAVAGLTRLLLDRGETEEARALLATVPVEDGIRSLLAEVELREAAAEHGELAGAARAALSGDHRHALERLLAMVQGGDGGGDDARRLMLGVFDLLGDHAPLTREFRGRLASALF
ncbi:MAG TPA: tetratricopeptide repeat protein [Actinomycetota bacterium]|nr:tetratricopeptide repeat protein [Actinomycetota bacterium]